MSFLTKLPRHRYSSDAFTSFSPEQNDFNLGTLKAMAWMAQLAYETDEPAKIADIASQWGLTVPVGGIISEEVATVLPKASTQVVVCRNNAAMIIAFAGTDPLVLGDWITDLDFAVNDAGTANGFTVAAEAVWSRIDTLLPAAPPTVPIFVTGHSLGGALAVLTARRIEATRQGRVRAVYAFGMPRAGNREFSALYNRALGSCTYRLVYGDDVVPTVAPSQLGFRHVGHHLHCARGAKFDRHALTPTTDSDDPQFVRGVSKQLEGLLNGPLSSAISMVQRWKLAAALALGMGPAGMRTDPGGLVIELLPPPLRDHMPDRYIEAAT